MDDSILEDAERKLGHTFTDRTLLKRALRHASQADTRLKSNERLEFLGDSVLGMVICEHLYQRYPSFLEGELTKIKSNVVSRRTCADVANDIGLSDLLQLGKGMDGRDDLPMSLAAAVFESLIGALYLDAGLEVARSFILEHLGGVVGESARLGHQHNFKSVLQQALQKLGSQNPVYPVVEEAGPDHAKTFHVCVQINDRTFACCWGSSKKQAEQDAALATLIDLGLARAGDDGEVELIEPDSDDLERIGETVSRAPESPEHGVEAGPAGSGEEA